MPFHFTWCMLLKMIFVAGLLAWDAQVGAHSWRLLFQVSILHQSWRSDCTPQVCGINASTVQRSVSYDDPCTCLTPCVDTRTWKGGPTGIAMAIRGWPVGVTNSLNRNWIYTTESNLRVIPMLLYLFWTFIFPSVSILMENEEQDVLANNGLEESSLEVSVWKA